MQSLFPLLPYVSFTKQWQPARFFPTSYIDALARHLNGRSATRKQVREFNATAQAQDLYKKAQADFTAAIGERTEHTPDQVAAILCVTRSAIGNWLRENALPFTRMKMRHGRLVPLESGESIPGGRQLIQAQTLRDLFTWEAPF
jgi:hypothetical protein